MENVKKYFYLNLVKINNKTEKKKDRMRKREREIKIAKKIFRYNTFFVSVYEAYKLFEMNVKGKIIAVVLNFRSMYCFHHRNLSYHLDDGYLN